MGHELLGGDVAVGPGSEGAPAVPAQGAVEAGDPEPLDGGADGVQGLAVGVVQVQRVGQARFGVLDVRHGVHDLVGGRGAEGVGQADVGDAHGLEGPHHPQQVGGVDLALEGAGEGGGDAGEEVGLRVPGHLRGEALQGVLDALPGVGAAVGLAGGGDHLDVGGPGRDGTGDAAAVEGQRRVRHLLGRGQAGQDLGGVAHLRDLLRVDEGGHLQAGETGGHQGLGDGELAGGGDDDVLVLEAVAQEHVGELDPHLSAPPAG